MLCVLNVCRGGGTAKNKGFILLILIYNIVRRILVLILIENPVITCFSLLLNQNVCVASAWWYSSPKSALPHGLDLWLWRWLQDEESCLISSGPRAQAKSNLHVTEDIYAITDTRGRGCVFLSSLTNLLKNNSLENLFQLVHLALQVCNFWNKGRNILFLKDLPVTSVSTGISSITHLSSNSPRSKYMDAASMKKHWRKRPTTRKLIFPSN